MPLRLAVYGSGISLDVMNGFSLPAETDFTVTGQSLASLTGPVDPNRLDLLSPADSSIVTDDARGSVLDLVDERGDDLDLLVIDLGNERAGVARLAGGGLLTLSSELHLSGALDGVDVIRRVPFGSEEHFQLFRSGLDLLVARLQAHHLVERTFALNLDLAVLADRALRADVVALADCRRMALTANPVFERYFAALAERGINGLRLTSEQTRMDPDHPRGLAADHFTPAVYETARRAVASFATALPLRPPAAAAPIDRLGSARVGRLGRFRDDQGHVMQVLRRDPASSLVLVLHGPDSEPSVDLAGLPTSCHALALDVQGPTPVDAARSAAETLVLALTALKVGPCDAVVLAPDHLAAKAVLIAAQVPGSRVVIVPHQGEEPTLSRGLGEVEQVLARMPWLPTVSLTSTRGSDALSMVWWLVDRLGDLADGAERAGTMSVVIHPLPQPSRTAESIAWVLTDQTASLTDAQRPHITLRGDHLVAPGSSLTLETEPRWVLTAPGRHAVRVTATVSVPAAEGSARGVLLAVAAAGLNHQQATSAHLAESEDPQIGWFRFLPVGSGETRINEIVALPAGTLVRAVALVRGDLPEARVNDLTVPAL